MQRVAVIDYGMGNLLSVSKALEAVSDNNTEILVTSEKSQILSADHIVFPGVGAIRDTMATLKHSGLDDVIFRAAETKPFLGICLGMQALLTHSEENNGVDMLNLIPGQVKHFDKTAMENGHKLKVPHMGWNKVTQTHNHPLWKNINPDSHFYFVHSYFALPDDDKTIAGTSSYPNKFTAAISKDNVFAVQFHPEKSQHDGLQLLKNFVGWDGQN